MKGFCQTWCKKGNVRYNLAWVTCSLYVKGHYHCDGG